MDLSSIFKAYDVRGLVPDQLDDKVAERIGAAFAGHFGAERIAVGYDARISSPVLADAFVRGVSSVGADVDELGMVATDMTYHAAGMFNEPAAMITASHNPKGWNGIKLCLSGASPVGIDSGLEGVRRLAEEGIDGTSRSGTRRQVDTLPEYLNHLLNLVGSNRFGDAHVAVDGGNGVAGAVIPELFDRINCRLSGLYLEPDGTFPNHHPDPLRPENLRDLIHLMEAEEPDLGVAFDGDADRAFFIDDAGNPLSGSTVTAILARWFLDWEPRATVVYNLICSKAVPEMIATAGGVAVRTRVGHSFIKKVMAETGAIFGGEHSGHYYFRDHYRADSGILAMLVLLRIIAESDRPLSEMRKEFEPYAQSGEINLPADATGQAIEAVADSFKGDHDRLDGLTVDLGDRWFNLRPSNTEPVIRLNVEAPRKSDVNALVAKVRKIVEKHTR
jgi:phosphomannomutase